MSLENLMTFPWVSFNVTILLILILDLGIFRKKIHVPTYKESLLWSAFWFLLAALFGLWILKTQGHDSAVNFFTGYAVEKSLSLDNIMAFVLIFEGLSIPLHYQHKILFWGIFAAFTLRILMIVGGGNSFTKISFLNVCSRLVFIDHRPQNIRTKR